MVSGQLQFAKKEVGESIFVFEDSNQNKLYMLVHLAPYGNLFIFANEKSIMLDHVNKWVVWHFLDMPTYSTNYVPTFASFILLPLDLGDGDTKVLIYGKGIQSSYRGVIQWNLVMNYNTCEHLRFTNPDPHWRMESMPMTVHPKDKNKTLN